MALLKKYTKAHLDAEIALRERKIYESVVQTSVIASTGKIPDEVFNNTAQVVEDAAQPYSDVWAQKEDLTQVQKALVQSQEEFVQSQGELVPPPSGTKKRKHST